jgi:hypothetical protein
VCRAAFSWMRLNPRHHCRACGELVCASCSSGRARLRGSAEPLRVCARCVVARAAGASASSPGIVQQQPQQESPQPSPPPPPQQQQQGAIAGPAQDCGTTNTVEDVEGGIERTPSPRSTLQTAGPSELPQRSDAIKAAAASPRSARSDDTGDQCGEHNNSSTATIPRAVRPDSSSDGSHAAHTMLDDGASAGQACCAPAASGTSLLDASTGGIGSSWPAPAAASQVAEGEKGDA